MRNPLLILDNLSKRYGRQPAVDRLSLAVEAGEIVCLLGPSGCGKTTLLRLIAGLETADTGTVTFDGREQTAIPPHERGFGMMFQEFALFPHKNVANNIAFGPRMHRWPEAEIRQRVAAMLELVDLEGSGERVIDQLSGGEQQRVALARALAVQPRLLLLDEPLGSLDRALRERLMIDLRHILKTVGVTAISVTHDQTEAFAIADRIVVMNAGRIEQIDRPEILHEQPATPFVARFLGYENLIPGEMAGGGCVETPYGRLVLPETAAGGDTPAPVTILIKPDALRLEPVPGGLVLDGRLTSCSFRGRYYQLWIDAGGRPLLFEQNRRPAATAGDSGRWYVDPGRCLVLPPV